MYRLIIIIGFIIATGLPGISFAQKLSPVVVSTSGNESSSEDWIISATVGEPVIVTLHAQNQILTQGFQQGPAILFGSAQHFMPEWDVRLFPNPASSFVTISFGRSFKDKVTVQVYDIYGKEVIPEQIEFMPTSPVQIKLNLSNLDKGNYLIRVLNEDTFSVISNFKIIKIR